MRDMGCFNITSLHVICLKQELFVLTNQSEFYIYWILASLLSTIIWIISKNCPVA